MQMDRTGRPGATGFLCFNMRTSRCIIKVWHPKVMQPSLSERWKTWSERMDKSGHGLLPNLGFGGSLVTIFVSSFFAAALADTVFVVLAFGPHAYFVEGLRVTDWKHGVLSTGAKIPFISDLSRGLLTLLCWVILIGAAEFAAGWLSGFLGRRPRWVSGIFRLGGGSLLVLLGVWFCRRHDAVVFHPVPCAALIGGAVLIWKAVAGMLRRKDSSSG
jgi:hypothetical protein